MIMRKLSALTAGLIFTATRLLLAADAPTTAPVDQKIVTPSGLTNINKGGSDALVAENGDVVWVDYTGRFTNGTVFDASANHPDRPFTFKLGIGQVIPGWDEGILGMKVGEKRQLIVPPKLGYGVDGNGQIPPNTTLIFDVQLRGLRKAGK